MKLPNHERFLNVRDSNPQSFAQKASALPFCQTALKSDDYYSLLILSTIPDDEKPVWSVEVHEFWVGREALEESFEEAAEVGVALGRTRDLGGLQVSGRCVRGSYLSQHSQHFLMHLNNTNINIPPTSELTSVHVPYRNTRIFLYRYTKYRFTRDNEAILQNEDKLFGVLSDTKITRKGVIKPWHSGEKRDWNRGSEVRISGKDVLRS